jgi:hypothetical protein
MTGQLERVKKPIFDIAKTYAQDWWVEILTAIPSCIYYFGPFSTLEEAQEMCPGYIQDLQEEGAQEINVHIQRCCPAALTIFPVSATA